MTQQGDKQTHPERGNSVGQLANRFLQPVNGGGGQHRGKTGLDQRDRNTTISVIREPCVNPDSNKPIRERHLLGL